MANLFGTLISALKRKSLQFFEGKPAILPIDIGDGGDRGTYGMPLSELTGELDRIDGNINIIDNDLQTEIEKTNNIGNKVTDLDYYTRDLDSRIDSNDNKIASLENAINEDVVKNIDLVGTESTQHLTYRLKNLKTGSEDEAAIALPIADQSRPGLMDPAMFERFTEMGGDIEEIFSVLANTPRTAVVAGLPDNPSQEQLTAAFTAALNSSPKANDRLLAVEKEIEYLYGNNNLWGFQSTAKIDLATRTNPGLVQHSMLNGCVGYYMEGIGQVNGWDDLVAATIRSDEHISNTTNPHNVTKVQVGLGNLDNIQQATKAEFTAHNNDNSRHLTAAAIPTTLPPSGAAGGDLTGTYPEPRANFYTATGTSRGGGYIRIASLFLGTNPSGNFAVLKISGAMRNNAKAIIDGVVQVSYANSERQYIYFGGILTIPADLTYKIENNTLYLLMPSYNWDGYDLHLLGLDKTYQDGNYGMWKPATGIDTDAGTPVPTIGTSSQFIRGDGSLGAITQVANNLAAAPTGAVLSVCYAYSQGLNYEGQLTDVTNGSDGLSLVSGSGWMIMSRSRIPGTNNAIYLVQKQ